GDRTAPRLDRRLYPHPLAAQIEKRRENEEENHEDEADLGEEGHGIGAGVTGSARGGRRPPSLAHPFKLGLGARAEPREILIGGGRRANQSPTDGSARALNGHAAPTHPAPKHERRDEEADRGRDKWRDPDDQVEAFRLRSAANHLAVFGDEGSDDLILPLPALERVGHEALHGLAGIAGAAAQDLAAGAGADELACDGTRRVLSPRRRLDGEPGCGRDPRRGHGEKSENNERGARALHPSSFSSRFKRIRSLSAINVPNTMTIPPSHTRLTSG